MGVAEELGLGAGVESEVLAEARRSWPEWRSMCPVLSGVGSLEGLPSWLRRAERAAADDVLFGLVGLASCRGAGIGAATAVVAWALLPGARGLAHRLRRWSWQIDPMVAAQLWIEIGTFPYPRRHKVAANVLAATRAGVLRECGVPSQVRRVDRTWADTSLVAPDSLFWTRRAAGPVESDPEVELRDLLSAGGRDACLTEGDLILLRSLLGHAAPLGLSRRGRSHAGLLSKSVTAAVGADFGVSAATARRRVRVLLDVLTANNRDLGDAA